MAKTSAVPKGSAPASRSDGSDTASGNKPAHTIRYRNLKATIWLNTGQNGGFYSVSFTRSYQDKDEQWHDATSFNTGDLPTLAKLANDAHSWINWSEGRARDKSAKVNSANPQKGASS